MEADKEVSFVNPFTARKTWHIQPVVRLSIETSCELTSLISSIRLTFSNSTHGALLTMK